MKRLIQITAMLILAISTCVSAYAAAGSVTITYNNGGRIEVLSQVRAEGNIVYVDDDNPVEFRVVPDSGYAIKGVYMNNQSLNISGAEAKTVSVAPKGTEVHIRATFIKSEIAELPVSQPEPEENTPATQEPKPEQPTIQKPPVAPTTKPTEKPSENKPPIHEEPPKAETPKEEEPAQEPSSDEKQPAGKPIDPPKGGEDIGNIGAYDIDNPGIGMLTAPNDSFLSAGTVKTIAAIICAAALAIYAMIYMIRKRS